MSRLMRLTVLVVVILAASVTEVSAGTPPAVVTGHGAVTNPNTPVYCPGFGLPEADPFTLAATGSASSSDLDASGAMTATVTDGYTCHQLQVTARVDCLLVEGNRAVAFVPVVRLNGVVPGGLSFNYFAIVMQDNGANGDIGALLAVRLLYPPQSCSVLGLDYLFNFLGYSVSSGDVSIH